MKFQLNDRINVYGFDPDDAGIIRTRLIVGISDDGIIETDAGEFVHPKQARRLLKPHKKEWVIFEHPKCPLERTAYSYDPFCKKTCSVCGDLKPIRTKEVVKK